MDQFWFFVSLFLCFFTHAHNCFCINSAVLWQANENHNLCVSHGSACFRLCIQASLVMLQRRDTFWLRLWSWVRTMMDGVFAEIASSPDKEILCVRQRDWNDRYTAAILRESEICGRWSAKQITSNLLDGTGDQVHTLERLSSRLADNYTRKKHSLITYTQIGEKITSLNKHTFQTFFILICFRFF